jgi:hypothetical protein
VCLRQLPRLEARFTLGFTQASSYLSENEIIFLGSDTLVNETPFEKRIASVDLSSGDLVTFNETSWVREAGVLLEMDFLDDSFVEWTTMDEWTSSQVFLFLIAGLT